MLELRKNTMWKSITSLVDHHLTHLLLGSSLVAYSQCSTCFELSRQSAAALVAKSSSILHASRSATSTLPDMLPTASHVA